MHMAYIIAVLMAALSFVTNKLLLRCWGPKIIISVSPAVEEAAKTLPAIYFGADIVMTHLMFGVLEAGHDWFAGERHRAAAACGSVLGHTLFGLLTLAALRLTDSALLAVITGITAHLLWNVTVIKLTA
jgi:hypothetical protein